MQRAFRVRSCKHEFENQNFVRYAASDCIRKDGKRIRLQLHFSGPVIENINDTNVLVGSGTTTGLIFGLDASVDGEQAPTSAELRLRRSR